MRRILGTIGATLAIVAGVAISAASMSTEPACGPCGSDGGTGMELFLDAMVQPDVDGLGDETQDPDGGGLGLDWLGETAIATVTGGDQILITAEPDGGSPAPTSNPVLSASMT